MRKPDHVLEIVAQPIMLFGHRARCIYQRPVNIRDVPPSDLAHWLDTAHCEVLYRINVWRKNAV